MENNTLFHITYGAVIILGMMTKLGEHRAKVLRQSDNKVRLVDTRLLNTTNFFRS